MSEEEWEEIQKRHDKEWGDLAWDNAWPMLLLIAILVAMLIGGGPGSAIATGFH